MIKAIIIDDESQARRLLNKLLQQYCAQVQVIDECADLPNGVKSIRKHKPDLVFLDIEMPGHSGLELLDFFDEKEIQFGIIFTTAYNEYAVKAFKLSAVDYLLKPLDKEDLIQAVERFERRYKKEVIVETQQELADTKIAIPIGQSIRFFEINDIVFLKAENTYTEIHLKNNSQKILVSRTLKNFEDTLTNHSAFYRCHKSYIINTNYIIDYVKSDGGFLVMYNKIEIPISSDKVENLLSKAKLVNR